MSKEKNTSNPHLTELDSGEFFPGNANRVRNKTVSLSAGITRQIREMASIPMQLESDDWNTPQLDGTAARDARSSNWNSQTALQIYPEETPAPHFEQQPTSPIVGFLVSYDRLEAGEVFPIRHGRSVITGHNMKASSKQILIPDDSISFAHAIIRTAPESGLEFIDQLSETGSVVLKNGAAQDGEAAVHRIEHGDVLKLGNRTFHICLIGQRPANRITPDSES